MRARLFEQSGDVIRSGWRLSEEKGYQQAARPGPTPGGCVGGWGLMIWMNHPAVIKETLNSPLWETDKFDSTVHQFSVLIPEVSVLPPGVHQSFLIISIFFSCFGSVTIIKIHPTTRPNHYWTLSYLHGYRRHAAAQSGQRSSTHRPRSHPFISLKRGVISVVTPRPLESAC